MTHCARLLSNSLFMYHARGLGAAVRYFWRTV